MKRRTKLSIVVITLAIMAAYPAKYFYKYFYREDKVERFFWVMSPETRKANVLRVLGSPDQIEGCGEWLWWGDDRNYLGKNQGRCIEMIRYNFFLNAYAFGFSEDGRAVSKYHYQSE